MVVEPRSNLIFFVGPSESIYIDDGSTSSTDETKYLYLSSATDTIYEERKILEEKIKELEAEFEIPKFKPNIKRNFCKRVKIYKEYKIKRNKKRLLNVNKQFC